MPLGEMLVAALDKRIEVNGKRISKRQLLLRAIIDDAQEGDIRALKILLPLIALPPLKDNNQLFTVEQMQLLYGKKEG